MLLVRALALIRASAAPKPPCAGRFRTETSFAGGCGRLTLDADQVCVGRRVHQRSIAAQFWHWGVAGVVCAPWFWCWARGGRLGRAFSLKNRDSFWVGPRPPLDVDQARVCRRRCQRSIAVQFWHRWAAGVACAPLFGCQACDGCPVHAFSLQTRDSVLVGCRLPVGAKQARVPGECTNVALRRSFGIGGALVWCACIFSATGRAVGGWGMRLRRKMCGSRLVARTLRAAPCMRRCACGTERAARIVWRVGSDWRFLSLSPSLSH